MIRDLHELLAFLFGWIDKSGGAFLAGLLLGWWVRGRFMPTQSICYFKEWEGRFHSDQVAGDRERKQEDRPRRIWRTWVFRRPK